MRKRGILLAAAVLLTANGCGRYEEVSVEPLLEAQTAGDRPGGAFREFLPSFPFPDLLEETGRMEGAPEEGAPREEKDGKIESYLTGEMVDVRAANRRPLAIMMSNDKAALPQYGINRAGVVYEAPVEGGMIRYMALIEEYDDLERIGSVRSCRTYYTYFAREFEGMYAHFGQSAFALPYLERMEHLNGIGGRAPLPFTAARIRKRRTMPTQARPRSKKRSTPRAMQGNTRIPTRGITVLPGSKALSFWRTALRRLTCGPAGTRSTSPGLNITRRTGCITAFSMAGPTTGTRGR